MDWSRRFRLMRWRAFALWVPVPVAVFLAAHALATPNPSTMSTFCRWADEGHAYEAIRARGWRLDYRELPDRPGRTVEVTVRTDVFRLDAGKDITGGAAACKLSVDANGQVIADSYCGPD
ncbi:MAG: hypothetical protein ACQEXJ_05480 [Myxococcota bacterium]